MHVEVQGIKLISFFVHAEKSTVISLQIKERQIENTTQRIFCVKLRLLHDYRGNLSYILSKSTSKQLRKVTENVIL